MECGLGGEAQELLIQRKWQRILIENWVSFFRNRFSLNFKKYETSPGNINKIVVVFLVEMFSIVELEQHNKHNIGGKFH